MDEQLRLRIDRINEVFEGSIQERNTNSIVERQEYYSGSRLAYKFLTSWAGNMHMGLSKDGTFAFDDTWGQSSVIESRIKEEEPTVVLDIASGNAATLNRLALTYKSKRFIGLDLGNGIRRTPDIESGVELVGGEFEQLPFRGESVDLAYSIESICYAKNPGDVVKEVSRVLRPGGLFINFDGYSVKPFAEMSDLEKEASEIIYKGMMVTTDGNDYISYIKSLRETGFDVENSSDLSHEILPTVNYLGRLASLFYRFPKVANKARKILPDYVIANSASGYLMPLTIASGLHTYNMTIARKL